MDATRSCASRLSRFTLLGNDPTLRGLHPCISHRYLTVPFRGARRTDALMPLPADSHGACNSDASTASLTCSLDRMEQRIRSSTVTPCLARAGTPTPPSATYSIGRPSLSRPLSRRGKKLSSRAAATCRRREGHLRDRRVLRAGWWAQAHGRVDRPVRTSSTRSTVRQARYSACIALALAMFRSRARKNRSAVTGSVSWGARKG